jgi:invasion protein IalB
MARLLPFAIVASILLPGASAFGQEEGSPGFRIKPSEVAVPEGIKPGQYQRIIRPFENWTLICDENLQKKQRVCNVTQIIENQAGQMAFSWSLAATQDGKPYMILRTAPVAKADGSVLLKFNGRKEPVQVALDGCNQAVCVGMLPVGPIMREQIAKNTAPVISYATKDGGTITVNATLKGLAKAVESIN